MKVTKRVKNLKKPFGSSKGVKIRSARYLVWEDAFDVEFQDGLSFLEPHSTIRKANRISSKAEPVSVEVDEELQSHFKVTYDSGEIAEVPWDFIRELPGKHNPWH